MKLEMKKFQIEMTKFKNSVGEMKSLLEGLNICPRGKQVENWYNCVKKNVF